MAAKLFLSPYTARNHVIRVLEKLGLSRRPAPQKLAQLECESRSSPQQGEGE
ncbi:MAG TPA: hypothetical protein VJM69_05090 [Dehalococcoidia bacterium]|nr:hypothetical protein [Dehalococcoidia bacterium]